MEWTKTIQSIISILAYFFDPDVRRRRERDRIWREFTQKQIEFREAVAASKPKLAAQIAKEMEDLREKHKFLYLA